MLLFSTKYPLNSYLILPLTVIQVFFVLDGGLVKTIFYLVVTLFFLYIFLGRHACKVEVRENEVYIHYFFFWEKDICVSTNKIMSIDYGKGFYDLFNDKTIGGLYVFPKYCYDKMIITTDTDNVEVCINTRMFMFDKLVFFLRSRIHNS